MPLTEYAELVKPLGLDRLLGCGGDGCVYSTKRGTVVKLTTKKEEYRVARFFAAYAPWEKAAAVPQLFDIGIARTRDGRVAYIERENLKDLRIDAADHDALFRLGREFPITTFLYSGGKLPTGLRATTTRLMMRMRGAVRALEEAGVIAADLDKLENWGTNAFGELKIRDFGQFDVPGYN